MDDSWGWGEKRPAPRARWHYLWLKVVEVIAGVATFPWRWWHFLPAAGKV
jgi:hypothetical protein